MPPRFFNLPTLNRDVCRLVLGTTNLVFSNEAEAYKLFDAYVHLGGNCLDTALNYLDAEISIGKWMKLRKNRENVVIETKGAHHNRERKRLTPKDISQDLSESLCRLQTDYIDLYVLHRDDPDQPVDSIIECLAREQHTGRIRAFGASNWSIPRLEEAAAYAASHQLPDFLISSPQFSLGFPNEPVWPNCSTARDKYSRKWYSQTNFPLFGWSVLGAGFFSNRYKRREDMSEQERERSLISPSELERVYYSERNFQRLERVNELAAQKYVSSIQLALAWSLNQPLNLFAVVGPITEREIEELFGAFEIELSTKELAWLDLESV